MARRYDSSTTTFSPEGRLHQVGKGGVPRGRGGGEGREEGHTFDPQLRHIHVLQQTKTILVYEYSSSPTIK